MKDLYTILGINRDASKHEIKQSFKKLSLVAHPDRGGSNEAMQLLNEAYAVLSDPHARKQFDEEWIAFQEDDDDEEKETKPIVMDYLSTAGVRYSREFKLQHAALLKKFQESPLEKGSILTYFEPFHSNLYELSQADGEITKYHDIFSLIKAKVTHYTKQTKDLPPRSQLTPNLLVKIFLDFLKGNYYDERLAAITQYIAAHLARIKEINMSASEVLLYEGILCIMTMQEVTVAEEHTLLFSIKKITDYAAQNVHQSVSFLTSLFQSKYFRNLVAQAIHLHWQARGSSFFDADGLQIFDGTESAKTVLDNLRLQFSKRSLGVRENDGVKELLQYVRLLKQFEKDLDRKEDASRTAIAYRKTACHILDWIPAFIGKASQKILINIFLQAGIYFQRASQIETDPAVQMADEKLAQRLYMLTFGMGHYATPDVEFYAYMHGLKCIAQFTFQDPALSEMVKAFQHRALLIADIFPFFQAAQSNVDLFMQKDRFILLMRQFLRNLVSMASTKKATQDVTIILDHPITTILYQAYEACLKDWYEEEHNPETEQKIRLWLMEELLATNQWTFDDVQRNIASPGIMVDRDEMGWLNPIQTLPLPEDPAVEIIRSIDAIEINHKTGEMQFFLKSCPKDAAPNDRLLTIFDFLDMCAEDIDAAFFSLDPVDPDMFYHPFNAMRFAPASVYHSPLFTSMLLTDYLLKFLTVGAEVQGQPPYELRSLENLVQRLPEYLRNIIDEFQKAPKIGSLHRFWIEAIEIPVALDERVSSDGIQKIALGKMKMVVKKHQMEIDPEGKLVGKEEQDEGWQLYVLKKEQKPDIEKNTESLPHRSIIFIEGSHEIYFKEEHRELEAFSIQDYDEQLARLFKKRRDENGKIINDEQTTEVLYRVTKEITRQAGKPHHFSAEYVFAKEFTLHYDEFAFYFPEFARLKELSRITVMIRLMKGVRASNKESVKKLEALLADSEHWQKRRKTIDEAISAAEKEFEKQYNAQKNSNQQKMREEFAKWRTDLAGLPGKQHEKLSSIRAQMGSIGISASSSQVDDICRSQYQKMRDEVTSQYGSSAWDQVSSEAWQTVERQKADVAAQLTTMQRNAYREQLTGLFSEVRDEVGGSSYAEFIESFLAGDVQPMAQALSKLNAKQMKQQIQKALLNPSMLDIEAALRSDTSAIDHVALHTTDQQFSEVRQGKDRQIAQLRTLVTTERQEISSQQTKLRQLDNQFEELGVGKDKPQPDFKGECMWVPASFWHPPEGARTRLVYGGVSVQARANIIRGDGNPRRAGIIQSGFYGNNQRTADRQTMLKARGFQEHHIASVSNKHIKNHELFQLSGVSGEARANKIYLPAHASLHENRSIHYGRHTDTYSARVAKQMDDVVNQGKSAGWSQQQYREGFKGVLSDLRQDLRSGNIGLNKHHRPKSEKW